MKSMFSDLKLQPQTNTQSPSESRKTNITNFRYSTFPFYLMIIIIFSLLELTNTSVTHHSQPAQAQTAAFGAADWSKITFNE